MKLFLTAIALLTFGVLPSEARVDPNTGNLVRLIERKGYTVVIEECPDGAAGWMNAGIKKMVICEGSDLGSHDAADTVRHEAWHIVQACNAGSPQLSPVLSKKADFVEFVEGGLTSQMIDHVMAHYPTHKHATELEAFTAARVMTAAQIMTALNTYC